MKFKKEQKNQEAVLVFRSHLDQGNILMKQRKGKKKKL